MAVVKMLRTMIFMIGNDLNDGCLLEVGVGWGSPSGPAPPRALTPGPSPAERERGVDGSPVTVLVGCLGALEGVVCGDW